MKKKRKKPIICVNFQFFLHPPHHQRILLDPRHQEELSQLSCHLLSDIKSMVPPEFLRLSGGKPWQRGPVAKIPSHIINKLKKEKLLLLLPLSHPDDILPRGSDAVSCGVVGEEGQDAPPPPLPPSPGTARCDSDSNCICISIKVALLHPFKT